MKQFISYRTLTLVLLVISTVFADDSQCGARNENPIRPCPQNDKACVRSYFQCRYNCKADLAAGDTLCKDDLKDYLPYFNLTVDQYNATVGGLSSGKIIDFLVDYQNNLLVLTVNFVNITIMSESSDFVYYQSAKEPRHTTSKTAELYKSVTITTIFSSATSPNVNEIFSVANISFPIYSLGPCITKAKDPVLVNLFKVFAQHIDIAAQEAFQTRSKVIAVDYIQKNLCNYGVQP